jgi:hypothetical protein
LRKKGSANYILFTFTSSGIDYGNPIQTFVYCCPNYRTGGNVKTIYESAERVEARAILRLVSLGITTLEGARDLIAVPEREEAVLKAFAMQGGRDGMAIGRAVIFREKVLKEFDQLVLASYSAEKAA